MKRCPECEEELEDDEADLGVCPHCATMFESSDIDEEPDNEDDAEEKDPEDE